MITRIIGIILIIIGLIILAIVPDVKIKFFIGALITWLAVIFIGRAFLKE